MVTQRTVLFVCVGNASRSMMAEAIFNRHGPNGWRAVSAGVAPARSTNPNTGPMLSEIGVPLPPHSPQALTEKMVEEAAVRISIGALDHPSSPEWFVRSHPRRWEVPDPHHLDPEAFREIRDALRSKVEALIEELGTTEPPGPS